MSQLSYQNVVDLGIITELLHDRGYIQDDFYWLVIEKINHVTETMCVENVILIVKGEDFSRIPKDTPLLSKSFVEFQELCQWVLKQQPLFEEFFQKI